MPIGREIHIGFTGPDAIYFFARQLGLPIYAWDGDAPQRVTVEELRARPFAYFEIDTSSLDRKIADAYAAIAARLGWTFRQNNALGMPVYDTPHGTRTTSPFVLGVQFDDGADDVAGSASIGLNLSSRDYPCVLDIESKSGTLGHIVDLEAMQPAVAIAREEIEKRLPAFKNAQVFLRDIFF